MTTRAARRAYYREARRLTPAVRCTVDFPNGLTLIGRVLRLSRWRTSTSFRWIGPVTQSWAVN